MNAPRAYVSLILPRADGNGYYFRTDLETPAGHMKAGVISNRYRWSEAVVDRAARIVELAKKGYEVVSETRPGEQSLVTTFRQASDDHAATNRINP